MTLYNNQHQEPLAIVGMACKYAGSINSPSDLHEQVLAARSMQGAMPSSRMDTSFYHHPNAEATGTTYTKGGYYLDRDVNAFDAPFFQLSELDVLAMDPQQKMLLENVYHALENGMISYADMWFAWAPIVLTGHSWNTIEGGRLVTRLCFRRMLEQ